MGFFAIKKFNQGMIFGLLIGFLFPPTLFAHEGRVMGDYRIAVGHRDEPAFASVPNALDLFVTRIAGVDKPINAEEGDTVDVEVFVQFCGQDPFSCGDRWVRLDPPRQARGTENRYNSDYLPTEPGVYAFRVTGVVGEAPPAEAAPLNLDEVFICGEGSQSDSSQFGCVEPLLAVPELSSAVAPPALDSLRRAFGR